MNVKVVNEREIIIEGHVEKKEGNTTSTKRFRKRYVLPEDIEVEKVTSVMSSDGVLTITTPKKVSKMGKFTRFVSSSCHMTFRKAKNLEWPSLEIL